MQKGPEIETLENILTDSSSIQIAAVFDPDSFFEEFNPSIPIEKQVGYTLSAFLASANNTREEIKLEIIDEGSEKSYWVSDSEGKRRITPIHAQYLALFMKSQYLTTKELSQKFEISEGTVLANLTNLRSKVPQIKTIRNIKGQNGFILGDIKDARNQYKITYDGWSFNEKTGYCLPPKGDAFFLTYREFDLIRLLMEKQEMTVKDLAQQIYGRNSQVTIDSMYQTLSTLNKKSQVPVIISTYRDDERIARINIFKEYSSFELPSDSFLAAFEPNKPLEEQIGGSFSAHGFSLVYNYLENGLIQYSLVDDKDNSTALTYREAQYMALLMLSGFISKDEFSSKFNVGRSVVFTLMNSLIAKSKGAIKKTDTFEAGFHLGDLGEARKEFLTEYDWGFVNEKTKYCQHEFSDEGFFLNPVEIDLLKKLAKYDFMTNEKLAKELYGKKDKSTVDYVAKIISSINTKSNTPIIKDYFRDYYDSKKRFFKINRLEQTKKINLEPESFLKGFDRNIPLEDLIGNMLEDDRFVLRTGYSARGTRYFITDKKAKKNSDLSLVQAQYMALLMICRYVSPMEFASKFNIEVISVRSTINELRKNLLEHNINPELIQLVDPNTDYGGYCLGPANLARPAHNITKKGWTVNLKTHQCTTPKKEAFTLSLYQQKLMEYMLNNLQISMIDMSKLIYGSSSRENRNKAVDIINRLNEQSNECILSFDNSPLQWRKYYLNVPRNSTIISGEQILSKFRDNPNINLEDLLEGRAITRNGKKLEINYTKGGFEYLFNKKINLSEKEAQYMAILLSCGYMTVKEFSEMMYVNEQFVTVRLQEIAKKTGKALQQYYVGNKIVGVGARPVKDCWPKSVMEWKGYNLNTRTGYIILPKGYSKGFVLSWEETRIMEALIIAMQKKEIGVSLFNIAEKLDLNYEKTTQLVNGLNSRFKRLDYLHENRVYSLGKPEKPNNYFLFLQLPPSSI